ncbi:MAG: glutamate-1-semialdehyde 2,1-aminomutase [Methanocellales archaeon]|nr:glutamate-1-semialdehyde 2,1-aminomutase [Methanocellales archaeon]MDD3291935.1 glutamate-1-semialdehyde 2,1-aminomutase [Methanocellales archaeon]MDD5235664.1 glutamate-1-semialdehyde 2,1-aminomutase [Methanocellales archaeon]MDD5485511.1 glutamate-1-semialdehyde 2,1-aminomutase [Methanocellales archaeon]
MRSEEFFNEARELLPGGVSSPVRAIKPYPFYTAFARGSKIFDVDGNEYVDYCMAYGPLILGHNPPAVKRTIVRQLDKGWIYGTPIEQEIALAKEIVKYYPSIDMVRFVNTGTEATMGAIRAARGFTGKDKIIKIEGGFHGAHDAVLVKAGSGATSLGTPDSLGIPPDFTKHTLQVPFNDIEAMTDAMDGYHHDIAAVILEPVMGNVGPILPEERYLQEVRTLTKENDIVLIFDEVITGFRLEMGGAQEWYGITPDMTTLGKILGGGFPIGVFGGKKEIMENISPAGKVYQAGTFNGNPVSLTAGLATIDVLHRKKIHQKVNSMGDELRARLRDIVDDHGLDYTVAGVGSIFKIFFGGEVHNYQDAFKCDSKAYLEFFGRMLKSGIFLPPSQFESDFLSSAHSTGDVERTINAYEANLA